MISQRTFFLFVFLLLSKFIFSQDLIINYTDPPSLTVCSEHTYDFTLTNTSSETLSDVSVTINTPTGIEYIAGTITVGTEQNISNPTAPIFNFSPIPPSQTVSFSIDTELKCPLVTSINSGVLFTNIISANWNGGNNSITTIPYLIETPLLVITDATNTVSSGSQGDIISRSITIQNTRLGALSSFTFSDAHGGGISISSNLGTLVDQTATSFTTQLTAADFMTIGDGDGLFEQNEVIVFTENVLVEDCGVTIPSTNSLYSVSWGCYDEVCQTVVFPALIDIVPSDLNPELVFEVNTNLPIDYCGGIDAKNSITITNIGLYQATDISLDLLIGLMVDPNTGIIETIYNGGVDPNSFTVDSAGIITTYSPIVSYPSNFDCDMPDGYFRRAQFEWVVLGANESITLNWDYAVCRSGCESPFPVLEYEYQYENNCPVSIFAGRKASGSNDELEDAILRDSIFYSFGEPLTTGNTYTLNYVLESTKLLGSGILNVAFELPCGLGWGNSDLELGGVLPSNIDVESTFSTTFVSAQYTLPLNADSVVTSFDITFNCDAPCGAGGQCVTPYISSSGELGCGTISTIKIENTLLEDTSIPLECGMKVCREVPLLVWCDAIFEPPYIDFSTDFSRCNFDEPDNDDDRLPDALGNIDLNLVRRDRAIPGDTVMTTMNGVYLLPKGEGPSEIPVITVQFEAHTADSGLNGGVSLDTSQNLNLFSPEGIIPISAMVRIVDVSTGQSFQCEIGDPSATAFNIEDEFSVVNTEPKEELDIIFHNQFKYNTTRANLSCLPSDFQYDQGDSIILITKHKMIENLKTQGTDLPPILNLRAGVVPVFCNDFNIYISALEKAHKKFQYSGYKYEILTGRLDANPCASFSTPGNIGARFVLGEDNFFPFEYRPLASLQKWQINLPDAFTTLESELTYLRYQQGDNVFSNENLNISTISPFLNYEVAAFHDPILDEGWEMIFFHEFEFECQTTFFEGTMFDVDFLLNEGLPESPFVNITQNEDIFFNASPNLNLGVILTNYTGFDNNAEWDLVIINASSNITLPAENSWLQPISSTGLITNFELVNTITGQSIPLVNGIFQLGTINQNEVVDYQLVATNNSCHPEIINLNYGWDCMPYTSNAQVPCRTETITLTATSPNGELEIDITSPIGPFDLCSEIDYHTVEIFNAQLGNVFDVLLETTILPGMQIISGSCQISYPSGNGFIDIPDPTEIVGNVFQWNISTLNTIIENSGLAGVSQTPNNSVSIRFKTTSECGSIVGIPIVFNTIAQQNCNEPTNTITKAGEPINISGVIPAYSSNVNVGINTSTAITCGAEVGLTINILPDGSTTDSDSVIITLPPGVTFIPNSYLPSNNAPNDPPEIIDNAGQQILKIEIPQGVPAFSLISFQIGTTGFGAFGCGEQVIQILATQKQDAICATTGELCYVLASTGNSNITISSEHPELSLQNFEVMGNNNSVEFSLDISNSGVATSPPLQVDIYIDNDGDGTFSEGDTFVGSDIYNGQIEMGETFSFTGNIDLTSTEGLCNLIAVIDQGNNCICGTEETSVNSTVSSLLPTQAICSGLPIEIGIPAIAGHTYQWDPPLNLSSTNSSMTTFQFTNPSQDPVSFNYTLIEQGATCEVQHSITVDVFPLLGTNTQNIEVCAGEELVLSVIEGGSYVWEGPEILNPFLSSQIVTLFEDATYNVTISLAPGCEGTEEINVTVLPFQESSSSMITCPEYPIDVFGEMTSTPGMYCDTFPTATGCDSMVCIELNNFISFTEEKYTLCLGDSVVVDGTTYFSADQFCDTNISSFGCDSTHCIIIEMVDTPMVELIADITISEGEEITLNATPGFPNYEWSPSAGLSCSNCPDPTVTLFETTNYSLTVTDENQCATNIVFLATVFPPCSPQRLQIPNVFTPDGDGINDTFGVADFEGFEMINTIKIFNRWGEKVYQDSGAGAKWDGTQKGKPAPNDVYVYIIRVECEEGIEVLHGDVTLIR